MTAGYVLTRCQENREFFTARFAGENATDDENIDKLLLEMSEVNEENRTAKFVCVIAVIDKNISENTQFFRGECNGYITKKEQEQAGLGLRSDILLS